MYEPGPTSPHLGHTNHLCEMVKRGDDVEAYKALVKSVKFMCEICGRVAAKAENLCEPISLLIFCQHFLIANDCRWRACIV